MTSTDLARRWAIVMLSAALLPGGGSAWAQQDPGTPSGPVSRDSSNCQLKRVGTQFVRCDNLTGNGAPAPSWLPED